MGDLLEKTREYGVAQSLIDTVAFWGINYAGNAVTSEIPKPGMGKTIIFLGSDIAIRNGYITLWLEKFKNKTGEPSISMFNTYIAASSFVLGTLFDLVKNKDFSKAFADNLINNGLGLVGNLAVDNLMFDLKYV